MSCDLGRLFASGVLGAACLSACAGELLPAFREADFTPERLAVLKRRLTVAFAEAGTRISAERSRWTADCADAAGSFPHERVTVRAGIADRLLEIAARDLKANDATSLSFAELEVEDLRRFGEYFALERAAWQTSPERPANRPQVIDASAFGLAGDGAADDGPALRKAIAAVRALGGRPSVLRIPAGAFLIGSPDRNNANLDLSALSNCVVTGVSPERTLIRFGVYDARGLFSQGSYNTVFRNFEIKWHVTPFFQGTVLDSNRAEGWFEMSRDPGSLAPDDPKFAKRSHRLALHTYTPQGTFVKSNLLFWNRRVEKRGEGRYRLYADTKTAGWAHADMPKKGMKGVLPDRLSGFEAFGLMGCTLCTVESVWIRNGREAFLQPSNGYWCSAVRCRIFPDAGFVFSTNADGFYNARGSWISDCEFRNMGDDGCNGVMHGVQISKAEGNCLWCRRLPRRPRPGDLWQLVDPSTGEYLANARLTACADDAWQGDAQLKLTFAEPLPPRLDTYETSGRGELTAIERREIAAGNLKLARPPDLGFVPAAYGVGYVVRRNRFIGLRNTAMVVQCPNALIEDNLAEGMQNGLCIGMLLQWDEGPAPYNVQVRGNTFRNLWHGIFTSLSTSNGSPPKTAPVRDFTIEGNTFVNISGKAITLFGADRPILRNNTNDQ